MCCDALHGCVRGTLHICGFELELVSRYSLTTGKPENVMLTSSCRCDVKPLLPGRKIKTRLSSAMGVILQSESISLLFPKTLTLLCCSRSKGTALLLMALLTCPIATCTVTLYGSMFGSLAASAVLFVTRIVKHHELAHIDEPESVTSLLEL